MGNKERAVCPDHPDGKMRPMPNDPSRQRCVPARRIHPVYDIDGNIMAGSDTQPKCKFTR